MRSVEQLCSDCQLANSGICDYKRNVKQINEAIGLPEDERQQLLIQEQAIAKARGCIKVIVTAPEMELAVSPNPNLNLI